MNARPTARSALGNERRLEMTEMRTCIGSVKFGIEAHEAPISDFPAQPSQKDGLGRMCKPHWRAYTGALRKAALARKAAAGEVSDTPSAEVKPDQTATRKRDDGQRPTATKPKAVRPLATRAPRTTTPLASAQGDAG